MRLLLVGPQGAGKGTQGARLAKHYRVPHVSTGGMFREAVAGGSSLGDLFRRYVESGKLVPDDLTVSLVRERLNRPDVAPGFILDGFPRNQAQAHALNDMLRESGQRLDAVLALDVPQEISLERIAGRRVCSVCGRDYHIKVKPASREGVCDVCTGPVIQREDDREDVVTGRLRIYRERTVVVLDHYSSNGVPIHRIDGVGSSDEVFSRIVNHL